MRVSPVSNYNQTNSVHFGKFADKNAKKTVKKALLEKCPKDDTIMRPVYVSWYERIRDCEFFEAYTDKKSGKVKGRFTDEFVKSENGKKANFDIKWLQRIGAMNDLSTFSNAEDVASTIENINDIINGIDPADKRLPSGDSDGETENYAHMRAEEEAYRG